MEIKKGQQYIVLEDFKKLGAKLYKNQTFEVHEVFKDTVRVTMIATDVLASPKDEIGSNTWTLKSNHIIEYCEQIIAAELLSELKEEEKEVPVKRYGKKEFKTMLENLK